MRLAFLGLLIAGAALAVRPDSAGAREARLPAASTLEMSAQAAQRPRITIYPRRVSPGPDAKRYCRAWLAREYRASGTVIVPRRQCWWQ